MKRNKYTYLDKFLLQSKNEVVYEPRHPDEATRAENGASCANNLKIQNLKTDANRITNVHHDKYGSTVKDKISWSRPNMTRSIYYREEDKWMDATQNLACTLPGTMS